MMRSIPQLFKIGALCTGFILFAANSYSQVMWQHTYGTPEFDDYGRWAIPNMDGGYSFIGHTKSWGKGDLDILYVETDTCGISTLSVIVRDKFTEKGRHLVQDPATGDMWIAGKSNTVSNGSQDVRTFNLTAVTGHLLGYGDNIGGAASDNGHSIQNTSDGGRIITGRTSSFGGGSFDVYLIKLDAVGALMWAKTYGGTGSESGNMVREAFDGGFIITGHSKSYSSDATKDVYLLRTDALGTVLWGKTYGSVFGGIDESYDVRQTPDSGFVVTGYMKMDAGFLAGGGPTGMVTNDAFLMKTDPAGGVTWINFYTQFPPAVSGRDIARSVALAPGGMGYAIAGYTESFSVASFDGFLILTDPLGIPVPGSSYLYGSVEFDDKIFSIEYVPGEPGEDGWLMCGHTNSQRFGADYDAWLLRAAAFGGTGCDMQVQWDHATFEITENNGAASETGGIQIPRDRTRELPLGITTFCTDCIEVGARLGQPNGIDITDELLDRMNEPSINVYPNPAKDLLSIDIFGAEDQPSIIRMFDMTGKMVMDVSADDYRTVVLNLSHLPEGAYMLQVLNNEMVKTQKIVVQ